MCIQQSVQSMVLIVLSMENDNVVKLKNWKQLEVIDVGEGELGVELDEDILKHLNIREGDTIIWEEIGNKQWSIRKQDDRT